MSVNSYGSSTYKQTLIDAEKSGKTVLIVFSAPWCGPCKSFHDNTLGNKEVKDKLKEFEYYEVNIDRENYLANKFGASSIPMYVVIDAKEKVVKRGYNNVGVGEFLRWLPTK